MDYNYETGSSNEPPTLIDLSDYPNWKLKFQSFLCYNDRSLWESISNGPHVPARLTGTGATVLKEKEDYDDRDKKLVERDNQAYAAITMGVSKEICHGFKKYKDAKGLWKALEKRCEGNKGLTKPTLTSNFENQSSTSKTISLMSQVDDVYDRSAHAEEMMGHHALMAEITESPKVNSNSCPDDCAHFTELTVYRKYNQNLSDELKRQTRENNRLKENEKISKTKIEACLKEISELKSTISDKNTLFKDLSRRYDVIESELKQAQTELEKQNVISLKQKAATNTLTEILDAQRCENNKEGLGYHTVPPPTNYSKMPDFDHHSTFDCNEDKCEIPLCSTEQCSDKCSTSSVKKSEQKLKKKRKRNNKKSSEKQNNLKTQKFLENKSSSNESSARYFSQNHQEQQHESQHVKKCFICGRTNHLSKVCYYNSRNLNNSFQNSWNYDYRPNNHRRWDYGNQWPGPYGNDYHQDHGFYDDYYFQWPRNQRNEFQNYDFYRNNHPRNFSNQNQSFSKTENCFQNQNVNFQKSKPEQIWHPKRKSEEVLLDSRSTISSDSGNSKSKQTWVPKC